MPYIAFSGVEKGVFAFITVAFVLTFSYVMWRRMRLMFLARKDPRIDQIGRRLALLLKVGVGQSRMPQEFIPGLLHILIFAGFMTLSVRTVLLFGMGFSGSWFNLDHIPGIGGFLGPLYSILKDLLVIGVLVGCAGFAWRRLVSKPVRMKNMKQAEPVAILAWISGLMLMDVLLEAGYGAWMRGPEAAGVVHQVWITPLGELFSGVFGPKSGEWAFKVGVWGHSIMVLGFLNYLPFGKHFHVITALPNTFLARTTPPGRLEPILNIEEKFEKMESDPSIAIGVAQVENLTWKQILDVYSCTECGRCVPFCPAWSTDKPLSHRGVNKTIRAHLMEKADFLLAPKPAEGSDKKLEWTGNSLTNGAVSAETIWSCTLCMDCEERCPVLIEQVPRIVDMRRHLSMIEGDIPGEVANFFKNVERNSNPWGLAPDKRADWIAGLEEGLVAPQFCELAPEEAAQVEYLFWVGCMGSYDDRSQKVTKALVKILNAAGVKFAVLGVEEQCNGETARRLGNEYLGQMLAVMNIQTMMAYGVKKVIAFCPHCFNTIKNDFPPLIPQARDQMEDKDTANKYADFAGFEVVHANELVRKLIADGRIQLHRNEDLGRIAYHDPCFLGRYNDIFDPQREMVALAGGTVAEPSLNRRQSYCCGAGGGRMWVEEHAPRVNHKRFDEIMESTGNAETIGVSCPFCLTMMTDSSKDKLVDDKVKVKDVIEIVADQLVMPGEPRPN